MKVFINILLGVLVNFIWGLAFVIPYMTESIIDPVLLVAGRYSVYGLFSCILAVTTTFYRVFYTLHIRDWLWAAAFAFAGNVGYYILLVLSIKLSGILIAALIVGISPITVAIYGNILQKDFSFRQLCIPLILIAIGLISLYGRKVLMAHNMGEIQNLVIGICFAGLALLLWTWYGVQNARYLKQEHQNNVRIGNSQWSIAVGICTFGITILSLFILSIIGIWSPTLVITNIFETTRQAAIYLGSIFVLGILVSYYATVLWNKISKELPISLVGQLIVFETIASILYKSIVDWAIPSIHEIISISIVLVGITFSIRIIYQNAIKLS